MVKNSSSQTGSAHVIIIIVLVVALLGTLGFVFWQNFIDKRTSQQSDQTSQSSTKKEEAKTEDPYKGWTSGKFTGLDVSYKLPPNWQDVSDQTMFKDTEYKYEEVKIKSPDGFVIFLNVHNLPRGYTDGDKVKVLDFKAIDSTYQWVINPESNGKISYIYVTSGISQVGQEIYPNMITMKDGMVMHFNGYFTSNDTDTVEFGSLAEFNQKDSVKTAKLVFESLVIK